MSKRVPLWLAVPAMAGLALFLVYPMGYLVALALTKSSLAKPLRGFVGGDNFTAAFASPAFTPSLVRSSVFAVVAAIVTTTLGLAIALLLRQKGSRFGIIGALFLLPLVTAPVLVGVAWKLLLAPVGGGLAGSSTVWACTASIHWVRAPVRSWCSCSSTSGSGHRSPY